MLGLRKGLLVRKRSSASSLLSDGTGDTPTRTPSRSAMETIRAGLQESAKGLSSKKLPKSDAVSVSVSVISSPDSVSSGKTALHADDDDSASTSTTSHSQTLASSIQVTRLIKTTRIVRGHICELGDYNDTFFETLDLESFLEFISEERLIHMPRRGSDWDRVLRAAQCFGLQLWRFGADIEAFCPGTNAAAVTALGSTQLLLKIGPHQAQALAPTFEALYELSLMIVHVSQIHDIFRASREVKVAVANLYCDVVDLVGNVATFYRREISKLSLGESITIEFEATFGNAMTAIWNRRDDITSRVWSLRLGHRQSGLGLGSIRRYLKHNRSLKGEFYDKVAESVKRTEDTCEWLKSPLVDFFRSDDKALTITGDSGTGKTVLGGWIKERLQRPLDHTQWSILVYTFSYDCPSQCTTLAFLKGILSQLLEKNVGDVNLYEHLSRAFEDYNKTHASSKLEDALWAALKSGLRTLNDRGVSLVLIVDAFHELVDERTPLQFHKALRDCVSKFRTIRVITLSKAISHLSDGCRHFTITPQHLHSDIRAYFRQHFSKHSSFLQLSGESRDKIVHDLVQKAKASFIFAYLVVRLLARQTSPDAFLNTARTVTTDGILKTLESAISFKNDATRTLLSFMLTADRALTVSELSELMRLNLQGRRFGPDVNLPKLIASTCSDLVVIESGVVRFKSKSVRTHFQGLMGKVLPSAREAHQHLTLALLLYSRLTLPVDCEVSFELLGDKVVDETFHSNALLYYAVKHWQSHFSASTLCGDDGALVLTKDFHEVFPTSCHFALLERSTWSFGFPASRLAGKHEFSLKIREACFGEKHISVLQNLVILGSIHVTSSELVTGARYFYRAATLGKVVLSGSHAVVMTCTSYFLQYTETITITTRTEIVTYREEMILLMIEICKGRHGKSSDIIIKWYKVLAQLYIDIKEEYRATLIFKILYEIYIGRDGKQSPEAGRLREHLGGLDIVLRGEGCVGEIEEYAGFFFETADEFERNDKRRVSILLQLAMFYESQKEWFLAEKIYITLWRQISEICRLEMTVTMHMTKITIALEFVRFLKRMNRVEEATAILICLWAEYEHHSFEEKTIIVLIREMGVLFRAFGLLQIAISIFTKVWGWFKFKGTVTDEDALKTTVLITEVVEEITETTVTAKTTTTTVTEVTETVVREIFETHFTRCKKSKVDLVFFKSCLALANLYIKLGNWTQAEVTITRSLEITWKAILAVEVDIKLSEHFAYECILVARRLAICYHRQRHFEKAERIYLRIYYACLASLEITDVRIEEALLVLIAFYEEHHRHERVIEIYVELLARYRKNLGASHKLTIKILYALAAHCQLLGRADAYGYYIEIVKILNTDRKHCHRDAFKAAVILVTYYYERQSWVELQHICSVLWETFVHHHTECVFTVEVIQLIYEKYIYVLEFHAKVKLSVLYEISVKYRETVTVVFGVSAEIVLLAMIALAMICERLEEHHHEAVTIYEEVITRTTTTKTTTTTVTETTITTVKKRLSKIYVTIITSGETSTTTTIERALFLCLEAYAQLKIEFGCWHQKTLFKLKDIIILYQKLGKESHIKIVELLQIAFVGIFTSGCGSMDLYQAAATLAVIYINAGLVQHGVKLVQYFRHLTIFGKDFAISTDLVVKLDVSISSRVAFVFLVAFEKCLVEKVVVTYSELMACILLEISLYEQYKKVMETETNIEIVLEYGAKLRAFWVEQRLEQMVIILDKRLFQVFKAKYSAFIKTSDEFTRIFYIAVLSSLSIDRAKVDFSALVCKAGNAKVAALIEKSEFKKALEVAKCTFHFAHGQGFYHDLHRVQYAYKLAEFMAGIDVAKPTDPKLLAEFLRLSKEITTEGLAIFKANKIDFVRLRFEDLSGIVRLLGSQQDFTTLESLLLKLWQSREVQKTWDAHRVVTIGRLMVHAHAAANRLPAALDLAETLCYNLRRSRGVLDPVTVDMFHMLASLYTADERVERAMGVHEQILREIEAVLREDGPKVKPIVGCGQAYIQDKEQLAGTAGWCMELLKRSHLRMGGAWTRPEAEYTALHGRLLGKLGDKGLKMPPPETWKDAAKGKKEQKDDMIGRFVGLRDWEWRLDGGEENGSGGDAGWVCGEGKMTVGGGAHRKGGWSRGVDHIFVATQEWLV